MRKTRSMAKPALCCLLLLLGSVCSNAQVADGIQKSFQQYNDHVLQEKIYVHTDKSFYLTGEILWFKIYNVDAGTNKPVDISKVAYADVLDEANNPVLQTKIALINGAGNGSFYIPVTLKNGNYKLRAYTAWMKNFGPDIYFEKSVTIVNPLAEPNATLKPAAKAPAIQFFAEGGNLVAGVTSTVGFKATGADGKGIDVSGVVIDQRNDTVARFSTLKFGMGSFLFTPAAGNAYKAVTRVGRDNALITNLPPVSTNGYLLHLTTSNNQPEIKISARGNNGPLYLFVHSGHQVVMAENVVPDASGNATLQIDKQKLGKGINHITLFNGARQPVCERLYFNRPDLLNLTGSTQEQFKSRSPVTIYVSAKDKTGAGQMANVSVSVFKLDSLNSAVDEGIADYLWLTSEIKGNIESPHYYFETLNAETDKALDNLLLIQGWSRFKWYNVLNAKQKFTYLPEYDGHIVTGQITNLSGSPAPNILAYLGVIGKRLQLYGAAADSTGRLLFNTKQLYGPNEIVLQTNTEIDSTYHIRVANPFSEQYTADKLPTFSLNPQWQSALKNTSLAMQLQNLYLPSKLRQYYNPMVDSSAFYGEVHKEYLLDKYTRFTTMEEVLREYVAEITVGITKNRMHFNVMHENKWQHEGSPLVILDGVPIFNLDRVFNIDPLKIRRLDITNKSYYWGPIVANVIINMTSYKGDMAGFELDPKAVVLDYEGMQLQREFYAPVYDTELQQKSRTPDFRNVLYWAPDVNTDGQGSARISFYTSDMTGHYIAVFQGLTADGLAGSYSLKLDVNN